MNTPQPLKSLIANSTQIAAAGALRKSQSISAMRAISLGLAEAFTSFEVPGKPTRFISHADPALGLSNLKAGCVFRKLKSYAAFIRVLEQTTAKYGSEPAIAEPFLRSIEDFVRLGGEGDILCMYHTGRGEGAEPDETSTHGWLWLTSTYKLKHVREVH